MGGWWRGGGVRAVGPHRTLVAMTAHLTAAAYFAAKLACETDASDVHAALAAGTPAFVLVDVRSRAAWDQGHIPAAVHIPRPELAGRLADYPAGTEFVVHCWGPGCNGATKAALAIAQAGYPVKEMIGGYEYWAREGLGVTAEVAPDPLTTVVSSGGVACAC